jgi:hypothetical protein
LLLFPLANPAPDPPDLFFVELLGGVPASILAFLNSEAMSMVSELAAADLKDDMTDDAFIVLG